LVLRSLKGKLKLNLSYQLNQSNSVYFRWHQATAGRTGSQQ